MIDPTLTRRGLLTRSAGLASWAALAATPMAAVAGAASAPYPTLAKGRLLPRPTHDYESSMLSGGPPKDGIPAIDQPRFWSAAEADGYLDPGDIVFGLVEDGIARAYPQRILVWHEIVNDDVGGLGLAVTYCAAHRHRDRLRARPDRVRGLRPTGEQQPHHVRPRHRHLVPAGAGDRHPRSAPRRRPGRAAAGVDHLGALAGSASRERGALHRHRLCPQLQSRPLRQLQPAHGLLRARCRHDVPADARRSALPAQGGSDRRAHRRRGGGVPAWGPARGRAGGAGGGRLGLHRALRRGAGHGYVFRGRSEAAAQLSGAGPYDVSWTGGETLEPVNSFQAMWFAWAAFYPGTAVHA